MSAPRTPPLIPERDGLLFERPVLPEQIAALQDSALHHAWVRAVRRVAHTIEYRAATRALTPAKTSNTWRTPWTTSNIATHALLVIRYQAAVDEGTAGMLMEVELQDREDGGAVLDAFDIPADDIAAPADFAPRWWVAPLDEVDGDPRPLTLPSPGGRQVELVIDGTDVRVLSVTVLELVPDDLETPPEP